MSRCKDCLALPPKLWTTNWCSTFTHDFKPSFAALKASATAGCPTCLIILWSIEARIAEATIEPLSDAEKVTLKKVGIKHVCLDKTRDHRKETMVIEYAVEPDLASQNSVRLGPPDFKDTAVGKAMVAKWERKTPYTNFHETFELIQAWKDNCLNNHADCGNIVQHTPTRLIDVGLLSNGQQASSSMRIRLVDCVKDSEHDYTYLALSHCWGLVSDADQRSMTTTTANIRERQKSIEHDSLPHSYRDAISLAHAMQVRYIWIDSLCIIQDSDEDWQRESSVMGLIYQNALFTVTANEAKDSQQGIFQHRLETPPSVSFTCHPDGPDNAEVTVTARSIPPKGDGAVWLSPLNKRAWVLQERQLSRRIVQFTRYGVFWECTCAQASEQDPLAGLQPFPPPDQKNAHKPNADNIGPLSQWYMVEGINAWADMTQEEIYEMRREWGDVSPPSPYAGWYKLVMEFSYKDLSKTSDVLPALAGISSEVARRLKAHPGFDIYVAGLWKEDLMFGLGWMTQTSFADDMGDGARDPKYAERRASCTRRTGTVAPSWSWVSICGPVMFRSEFPHTGAYGIEILEMSSIPVSQDNPMGAISSVTLRITALMVPGHWGLTETGERIDTSNGYSASHKGVKYDTLEDESMYADSLMMAMYIGDDWLEGAMCLALVATGVRDGEYKRIGWMKAPGEPTGMKIAPGEEFIRRTITFV